MEPPPHLLEEIVEAILLRVPPDDPATLFRAALVCKPWCRLVSDPGFRRRFRLFHRAAPMLGFVYRRPGTTGFTPTSSFRPPAATFRDWRAVDARHGRILFCDSTGLTKGKDIRLIVSDPVTGEVRRLPFLLFSRTYIPWNAALLCAAAGCDHLDCAPGGPFVVIWLGTDGAGGVDMRFTSARVYSSEAGKWSLTARIRNISFLRIQYGSTIAATSTLVGNELYFLDDETKGIRILDYNLGNKELSFIKLPPARERPVVVQLMTAEGGGLGFAGVRDSNLYLWSRDESVPSGWTQQRVIEIRSLLPTSVRSFRMIAFADGVGVLFISAPDLGVFAIDLKSGQVTKVSESDDIVSVVPYMSFCTPALRAASTKHISMSGQEWGASNNA